MVSHPLMNGKLSLTLPPRSVAKKKDLRKSRVCVCVRVLVCVCVFQKQKVGGVFNNAQASALKALSLCRGRLKPRFHYHANGMYRYLPIPHQKV
jgi:hypothetical protein